MPRASKPWVRPSTTSPPGASAGSVPGRGAELLALLDGLEDSLRARVFTHPSFVEERGRSYERLEFLGDSVLELAIAQALYEQFPESSEGELTRIRATVVSRASCAVVGRRLSLHERLRTIGTGLAPVEDLDRLASTRSVVSAILEAALGALYVSYGFERIRGPIVDAFSEQIEEALTSSLDAKTALQEELARRGTTVSYTVLETAGPPHARRFTCAAVIDGTVAGVGVGPSKKHAEQIAAKEALAALAPVGADPPSAPGGGAGTG